MAEIQKTTRSPRLPPSNPLCFHPISYTQGHLLGRSNKSSRPAHLLEPQIFTEHTYAVLTPSKWKSASGVQLLTTPWTVGHQAPLFMGFSRQGYWNGLPFTSPGVFSEPGIEPRSPTLRADFIPSEPRGKPRPHQTWALSSHLIGSLIFTFSLQHPLETFYSSLPCTAGLQTLISVLQLM